MKEDVIHQLMTDGDGFCVLRQNQVKTGSAVFGFLAFGFVDFQHPCCSAYVPKFNLLFLTVLSELR